MSGGIWLAMFDYRRISKNYGLEVATVGTLSLAFTRYVCPLFVDFRQFEAALMVLSLQNAGIYFR